MGAPTEFKRVFLQSLKWDAEDNAESFYATLKAAARARVTNTHNGKVLISTSANGKSASFSIPPAGAGVTPTDIVVCLSEFLDGYIIASANISARSGTVDDAAILTEMLALMVPVRQYASDFSFVR